MAELPLRLAIHGAAGRIGRQVIAAAAADPSLSIVAAVARAGSPVVGQDAMTLAGVTGPPLPIADDLDGALANCDVAIDFSTPGAIGALVAAARRQHRGLVVGTTGLSEAQLAGLRDAGADIPVFVAANLGVGVNVLARILPTIAQALGSAYDVEVIEAHHRHKKDAPSGTALWLARVIADALDRDLADTARYGRQGVAPRQAGEIGMHAVRAGGIVGEHHIIFASEGEQVEISHRAFSRQTFAMGALRAARFLAGCSPGYYGMADLWES